MSRVQTVEFSSYGIAADAITLLERIWQTEAPIDSPAPNLARIVKDAKNNIRESLLKLQTELMLA